MKQLSFLVLALVGFFAYAGPSKSTLDSLAADTSISPNTALEKIKEVSEEIDNSNLSLKLQAQFLLCIAQNNAGNYLSASNIASSILQQRQTQLSTAQTAYFKSCLAMSKLYQEKFTDAVVLLESAVRLAEKSGNRSALITAMQVRSLSSSFRLAYAEGLEDLLVASDAYQSAIDAWSENDWYIPPRSTLIMTTAMMYYYLEQHKNALEQLKQNNADKLHDSAKLMHFTMLAEISNKLGNTPDVRVYQNIVLETLTEVSNKHYVGIALGTMANISIDLEDYDKAIIYATEAQTLFAELNRYDSVTNKIRILGKAYLFKGDYRLGLDYLNLALNRYDSTKNIYEIKYIYEALNEYYSKIKNYQEANNAKKHLLDLAKQQLKNLENSRIAQARLISTAKEIEMKQRESVIQNQTPNSISKAYIAYVVGFIGALSLIVQLTMHLVGRFKSRQSILFEPRSILKSRISAAKFIEKNKTLNLTMTGINIQLNRTVVTDKQKSKLLLENASKICTQHLRNTDAIFSHQLGYMLLCPHMDDAGAEILIQELTRHFDSLGIAEHIELGAAQMRSIDTLETLLQQAQLDSLRRHGVSSRQYHQPLNELQ
ncbi:hypothetical protein [Paraferrimonas haliotis]|uniref:MalT-like TPR region domain-containing protein n=1 Tax=Paraferrimonas haliotis TaxID=2013866 RepID=A0AA37TQ07_9GAMM|nr:hypothetical protein [Paraferrimonas haliotis]GLS84913.1 hypothetical protein GCM10007894_28900 [Paraferrimonas haliotis]